MSKYLTKSKFKLALECPTKLYYESLKERYYNSSLDDSFLLSLAEGGFQVGELAKLYFPGGVDVETLNHDEAINQTEELLQQENVIIYEAAFRFRNLFIRADILIKNGTKVQLIEVKAKSINKETDSFLGKTGGIKSEWKSYLYDTAFQKHVVTKSHPDFDVSTYLLLADKTVKATIDGLNQKFVLVNNNGRTRVTVNGDTSLEALGEKVLTQVNVDDAIDIIYSTIPEEADTFESLIEYFSESYSDGIRISHGIGSKCASCEFISHSKTEINLLSGYHECWKEHAKFTDSDFDKPSILSLWDFKRKDEYIRSGKYFLSDLTREDLESKSPKAKASSSFLSRVDRQELQILKHTQQENNGHYIDKEGLRDEMKKWEYPLHFIDFETSAVAIPFNKGRRPYEQIAFQFSHHIIREDGSIEHAGQWINTERGVFPNFNFVRALKEQLEHDNGTIFRYAPHENTILNAIYIQLVESDEVDKIELCEWIKTITQSKSTLAEKWTGDRNMVDLWDLVKKYYYHPHMKGSNSIKDVLPAILQESDHLQSKYSQPIYGTEIKSSNYDCHTWITLDENGTVINPYSLLLPINEGYNNKDLEGLILDEDGSISDGGAAMIAYAKMQFSEMSDTERGNVVNALLRYCELDTFAMVLIWEAWNNWCN